MVRGTCARVAEPTRAPRLHRSGQANQSGDTIWIYQDSLETRSSPGNEGGFTHQDGSFQPAAWHIDTIYGCQGHAFWCGRVDSTWVLDANRYGYDNNWTQTLTNFVNLTGAASPVKLGFRQQLGCESGFDFASVEILDLDDGWIQVGQWTGAVHGSGVPCDTFTVVIPDTIRAKYNPVQFRFVFTSDIQGFVLRLAGAEHRRRAVDNVTVKAGINDLRFFDDFESGPGTWTVSTFPAVGDFWRIQANAPGEQICTTNTSKVWNVTNPATSSLTTRMDDKLISPPIFANRADQVFAAFDVYRNLPVNACFYYNVQFRTRNAGDPAWSLWTHASGDVYSGNEKEWMRQTVGLTGAGGQGFRRVHARRQGLLADLLRGRFHAVRQRRLFRQPGLRRDRARAPHPLRVRGGPVPGHLQDHAVLLDRQLQHAARRQRLGTALGVARAQGGLVLL